MPRSCVAVCCSALQCVAVCFCSVLRCVAVCCSVLQRVAACCSVLQCIIVGFRKELLSPRSGISQSVCVCVPLSLWWHFSKVSPTVNLHSKGTWWRRPIGCLKLQVIFRKRATKYRALLQKKTCKDKAPCGSSPPSSMGWLLSVGSIKLYVSFAEYRLFYRALLQKRPIYKEPQVS